MQHQSISSMRINFLLFFLFLQSNFFLGQNDSIPKFKLIQLENAQNVIKWKENKSLKNYQIQELKKIAESYALLNENEKALMYLKQYIITSKNPNILNSYHFFSLENDGEFKKLKERYATSLSFKEILFLISGIIGLFLSILILVQKNKTPTKLTLSFFVLLLSFFTLHTFFESSKFKFNFPHLICFSEAFILLVGPLLYLYFKSILTDSIFKKNNILHFSPFVLSFIYFSPLYFSSVEEKLQFVFNLQNTHQLSNILAFGSKITSLLIYSFLIYITYKAILKKNEHLLVFNNWLKILFLLFCAFTVSYLIYGISTINNFATTLLYPQVIVLSITILYIAYKTFITPLILSPSKLQIEYKYQKSVLTPNLSLELKTALVKLLKEDKIYRENDLTLESLSEKLGTSKHSLSQVINEHFNLNFFNLINKYRIEEAVQIFQTNLLENKNIIDVAYEVGFNNKVTFSKAFKKFTTKTPSALLKELKDTKPTK